MWRVEATGIESGATYVYEVEGPEDASPHRVFNSACLQHGALLRQGEVGEFLSIRIDSYTVEYIGDRERA